MLAEMAPTEYKRGNRLALNLSTQQALIEQWKLERLGLKREWHTENRKKWCARGYFSPGELVHVSLKESVIAENKVSSSLSRPAASSATFYLQHGGKPNPAHHFH